MERLLRVMIGLGLIFIGLEALLAAYRLGDLGFALFAGFFCVVGVALIAMKGDQPREDWQ